MVSPADPRAAATSERHDDWAAQVADTVDNVVTAIRDKTAVPAETVARAFIYGILIAVMAGASILLVTTAAVRLLDNWLRIWAVYLIIGGVFTVAGTLCWAFRRPRTKRG